jgi:hypothetical protein
MEYTAQLNNVLSIRHFFAIAAKLDDPGDAVWVWGERFRRLC